MLRSGIPVSRFWLLPPLLLAALAISTGCAGKSEGLYGHTRTVLSELDDFGVLLLSAGLAPEALPAGREVTAEEAGRLRLLITLLLADGSMQRYGPRVTADFLLAEIVAGGRPVSRATLAEGLRRFEQLTVLRPEGYLASVMTGTPVQCVGPVQVQQGTLMSGDYKVGALYTPEGTGFREDTRLPRLPGTLAFTTGPASLESKESPIPLTSGGAP
jgi:hypothetical protein